MQIKLLRTILFLFITLSCTALHAQNPAKREVGIQISGLEGSFGGFYKKQLSENTYRRIRFYTGSISGQFQDELTQVNLFFSAAIGREKRKSLDDRLEFYRGPEFTGGLGFQHQEVNGIKDTGYAVLAGIGYVLGLQHSFNDRWAIQIETIPGIRVRYDISETNTDNLSLNASISSVVALGVARKF